MSILINNNNNFSELIYLMVLKKIESFESDLVLLLDDIVRKLKVNEGDRVNVSVTENNGKRSIVIEKV